MKYYGVRWELPIEVWGSGTNAGKLIWKQTQDVYSTKKYKTKYGAFNFFWSKTFLKIHKIIPTQEYNRFLDFHSWMHKVKYLNNYDCGDKGKIKVEIFEIKD